MKYLPQSKADSVVLIGFHIEALSNIGTQLLQQAALHKVTPY
jgi:hypothetical protein